MKFYISTQSHTSQTGWFKKRTTTELVSICIFSETGNVYHAVNEAAARMRGLDREVRDCLPQGLPFLWKSVPQIALEAADFILHNSNGKDIDLVGYSCNMEYLWLHNLLVECRNWPIISFPNAMIDLWRESSRFARDNEEYIRSNDNYTRIPSSFQNSNIETLIGSHVNAPAPPVWKDSKSVATWLVKFDKFLEELNSEMIMSAIPEIEE